MAFGGMVWCMGAAGFFLTREYSTALWLRRLCIALLLLLHSTTSIARIHDHMRTCFKILGHYCEGKVFGSSVSTGVELLTKAFPPSPRLSSAGYQTVERDYDLRDGEDLIVHRRHFRHCRPSGGGVARVEVTTLPVWPRRVLDRQRDMIDQEQPIYVPWGIDNTRI